jgi:hypothetical protein
MPFPIAPPTDNLYKFIAIVGLLILGFCVTYPWILKHDINMEKIKTERDLAILNIKSQHVTEEDNALGDIYDEQTQDELGSKKIQSKLDEDHLKARTTTNDNLRWILIEKYEEIKAKQKQIELESYWIKLIVCFSYGGIFIGIILVIVGFRLWYFRFQMYQDAIIKDQAINKLETKGKDA